MEALGRIHADIAVIQKDTEWMKKSLAETKECLELKDKQNEERFASKYIEKLVWLSTSGVLIWVVTQVLNLIPVVKAIL